MNELLRSVHTVAVAIVVAGSIATARGLAAGSNQGASRHSGHPSAAETVAAYTAAAGVEALRAVHTRTCSGEIERLPSGTSASEQVVPFKGRIELSWKEPGRAREVWADGAARTRRISDGEHGWEVGTNEPRREMRVVERVELSRLGVLYQPAMIIEMEQLSFLRLDKVGGRPAVVLQTKNGELLWFDQETNLPARIDLLVERSDALRAGEFYLSQVFFENWQAVGASQLPHTIRRVLAEATVTYHFTEMKQDLELSNGLFKIPYFWRQ